MTDEAMSTVPAALFFDVDGTLVRAFDPADADGSPVDLAPSPAVRAAFARLLERGHKPVICTGRTLSTIHQELLDLRPAAIVSGAGACVSIDGKIVSEEVIPCELLRETVERLVATGSEVVLEGARRCVALMRPGRVYEGIPGVATVHDFEGLVAVTSELSFEKFAFFIADAPELEREGDFLFRHYTLCDLGVGLAEMSLRGVDKGSGVRRAVEALGSGPWRTFGFGDSENDLPMLTAVDVPVAMGNALPAVKEAARYVTLSVADDGVPAALRHFGLI